MHKRNKEKFKVCEYRNTFERINLSFLKHHTFSLDCKERIKMIPDLYKYFISYPLIRFSIYDVKIVN